MRWPCNADGTVAPVGATEPVRTSVFFFFAGLVGLGVRSSDCPLMSLSSASTIE